MTLLLSSIFLLAGGERKQTPCAPALTVNYYSSFSVIIKLKDPVTERECANQFEHCSRRHKDLVQRTYPGQLYSKTDCPCQDSKGRGQEMSRKEKEQRQIISFSL